MLSDPGLGVQRGPRPRGLLAGLFFPLFPSFPQLFEQLISGMGVMGRDSNGPGTTGRGAEEEKQEMIKTPPPSRCSGNFVSSETGNYSEMIFIRRERFQALEALLDLILFHQQVETHFVIILNLINICRRLVGAATTVLR